MSDRPTQYLALHLEIVRRQQGILRLHAEREGIWRLMTREERNEANALINAAIERGSPGAAQRPVALAPPAPQPEEDAERPAGGSTVQR